MRGFFLFKNTKKPNKAKCNVDVIIKFKIIPIFVPPIDSDFIIN